MIYRVFSDLGSFKNQTFQSRLNLFVAHRATGSTERQTRNRAGKTSLVEIIHFLLGAKVDKDLLGKEELKGYSFGMEIDLLGERITCERNTAEPAKVLLTGSSFLHWAVIPSSGPENTRFLSNTDWKIVLGCAMFGLDASPEKHGPSFRALISYFTRSENQGGFVTFKACAKMQQVVSQQVVLSFLIGLDWRIPQRIELLREQEKSLKELKRITASPELAGIFPSSASLRTQLAVTEGRVAEFRTRLASYRVHEQYRDLEKRASALNREILDLSDSNALDRQMLEELQTTITVEEAPAPEHLRAIYAEAGLILPEAVLKRFEDVRAFHESIVQNRRLHLAAKIKEIEVAIPARDQSKARLDLERAQIMKVLESHGALEHFQELQSELAREEGRAEQLRLQFDAAERVETEKGRIGSERSALHNRLLEDFRELQSDLADAIQIFESFSGGLYKDAGSLEIDHSDNGPTFEVKIQGQRSKGVKNMQIFCFDLMMMRLCARKGIGPGFLVHDSHLFDGVDPRQVATAMMLAAKVAEEDSFQYIVTFNSDTLEHEEVRAVLPLEFIARHSVRTRIDDSTDGGGLFGFRF